MRLNSGLYHQIQKLCKKYTILTCHQQVLLPISRRFSQWDIIGGVCLERKPIVSQSILPLEQKYLQYIQKLEIEKSLLSVHEKRQIEEKRIAIKLKEGLLEDSDAISKQTVQDFEDACTAEFNKYRPASRIIGADRHCPHRKLDSSLVFVIKQKLGNDCKWILPQTIHREGETLRQTAERALSEMTAYKKIQFIGNAPIGYYKYKYPKAVRGNGICGAKVFFYKAHLLRTQDLQTTEESVKDHLWLTHKELKSVLQPTLFKTVQSFLYPDILNVEDNDNCDADLTEEDCTSFQLSASN